MSNGKKWAAFGAVLTIATVVTVILCWGPDSRVVADMRQDLQARYGQAFTPVGGLDRAFGLYTGDRQDFQPVGHPEDRFSAYRRDNGLWPGDGMPRYSREDGYGFVLADHAAGGMLAAAVRSLGWPDAKSAVTIRGISPLAGHEWTSGTFYFPAFIERESGEWNPLSSYMDVYLPGVPDRTADTPRMLDLARRMSEQLVATKAATVRVHWMDAGRLASLDTDSLRGLDEADILSRVKPAATALISFDGTAVPSQVGTATIEWREMPLP